MPNGQLRDKVSGADDLHHAARASLSCSKQVLVLVLVPLCVRCRQEWTRPLLAGMVSRNQRTSIPP